jgi:MarR family transcriptional regulator, 2-MHQ and catechol-resistance regulon repressor
MELWRSVSDAWKTIHRESERTMSKLGICSTEFKILRSVHESRSASMAKLSADALLTQPAITFFVDKLEKQGLVKRTRSHEDRRVINIAMTSKGEALFKNCLKVHSKFVKESMGALSKMEATQLSSIMNKLAKTDGSTFASDGKM